jgi:hypothetical protein
MVLCSLCKALTEILLGADDKQLDPWFPGIQDEERAAPEEV